LIKKVLYNAPASKNTPTSYNIPTDGSQILKSLQIVFMEEHGSCTRRMNEGLHPAGEMRESITDWKPHHQELTWPWCSRLVATSGTSASCRPKTRITAVHTTLSLKKQPQPP